MMTWGEVGATPLRLDEEDAALARRAPASSEEERMLAMDPQQLEEALGLGRAAMRQATGGGGGAKEALPPVFALAEPRARERVALERAAQASARGRAGAGGGATPLRDALMLRRTPQRFGGGRGGAAAGVTPGRAPPQPGSGAATPVVLSQAGQRLAASLRTPLRGFGGGGGAGAGAGGGAGAGPGGGGARKGGGSGQSGGSSARR